ncbi:hypothetical protein [Polynucleobacter sp. MG-6-Vaara-E2]|uniref:hypothetical protein n=1 Tax=Polynucleobacter sp. MG-6-Vaara-E2 TaxID=2576932 RepID=UPI001BFCEFE6|nr:hypothetical protein [Polynucleobacter sp. MG-6-Vaara-E2]QWD95962.1 hypothetical protein ICV38_06770 [Polynucleobacter sp. MG-6-Vaara-E2]
MNYSESFFFILTGILVIVGLIIFLLIIRKRNEEPLTFSSISDGGVQSESIVSTKRVSDSLEAVDEELERLIEIESSLLAVKELYLKRLISAQKYVEETRLIAQQKIKY